MKFYELQLSPLVIYSFLLKKALQEKLEYYYIKKNRLRLKLTADKKAFAIEMDLRPSFYKLRPIDLKLQLRHNNFKLSPISSTTQNPNSFLINQKACLYSSLILSGLQDTACQYRTSINRKFLTVEFIKTREQNNLKANYKFRLQLTPYRYTQGTSKY